MVMKKTTVIAGAMVMLLFGNWTQAGVSVVKNGSFENDGSINPITTEDPPQYWCDVNIPSDEFGGKVDTVWSTHGYNGDDHYSLTLYSKALGECNDGDMAMVSQQVYLDKNVNKIIFDLKLSSSYSPSPWDPNTRSAVVLIDGHPVWDSNDSEPDSNDEYRNQEVDITDVNGIGDANLHTLSLAIKSNVNEAFPSYVEYRAHWDFVKFDAHCGGFGYLPGDLNQNCYVDMNDLGLLADQWLTEEPNYIYDLFQDEDDIVNFLDFAILADGWMDNTDWENWQDDNCYEMEMLATDLNNDGIVDYGDIFVLAYEWLNEGNCIRADLNDDNIVNLRDFAIIAGEWLLKSWPYGLD